MKVPVKYNLKIGGQPPNLGVAEERIFRQAPACRRLAAKLYYVNQPSFVQLLGNRFPYNIYPLWAKTPETFSPAPAKRGLICENSDFFRYLRGRHSHRKVDGAPSRMWFILLQTGNKRSKFQPPEILSSGDTGRQIWHRVIWPENRHEKTVFSRSKISVAIGRGGLIYWAVVYFIDLSISAKFQGHSSTASYLSQGSLMKMPSNKYASGAILGHVYLDE